MDSRLNYLGQSGQYTGSNPLMTSMQSLSNHNQPYNQSQRTTLSEIFGTPTNTVVKPNDTELLLAYFKLFASQLFEKVNLTSSLVDNRMHTIEKILNTQSPTLSWTQFEVDSTRRNRNEYPLSSNFSIPFTNSSSGTSYLTSADPVFLAVPYSEGLLQAGSTVNTVVLSTVSSTIDNWYIKNYIYISGIFVQITAYNGTTKIATISPSLPLAPPINTPYYIQKELPTFSGILDPGSTTKILVLPSSSSDISGTYTNMWLTILSGPAAGENSLIQLYSINGGHFAYLKDALTVIPGNAEFEIAAFSYDNLYNLRYSGTRTGTSQPVCYAVILTQLNIPRLLLTTGRGGYANDYPYVLVHFHNYNNHTHNIMYGNTPAAKDAIFKVPLPVIAVSLNFLNAQNLNTTTPQVINFTPSDSVSFSVSLPSGEFLEFDNQETYSPLIPNPLVQISAVFAINRLPIPVDI